MNRLIKYTLITQIFFAIIIAPSYPQKINIVTSDFPPFNYVANGIDSGFCTEIVQAILKDLKIQTTIKTHPWARSYQIALKQKNTLIYTIARTPERENLFHWVAIIITGKTFLFSLSDSRIQLDSLSQANQYNVGAVLNGIRSKYLHVNGIESLDLVEDSNTNALKLLKKRIDLWAEDELSAVYVLKRMGYNSKIILKKSFELDLKLDGYLAFSLDSDPKMIEQFRNSLQKLKNNGEYDKIKNKYINPAF